MRTRADVDGLTKSSNGCPVSAAFVPDDAAEVGRGAVGGGEDPLEQKLDGWRSRRSI
jgi:hypothetical protein